MLQWGLYAAALRLPFLPTRAGLGSDALALNPWLRTVRSPYDDGEELVAMRALELDAALVHMHRADASGNAQILGPDPYFDDLFCMAAKRRFVSCERVVPTEDLARRGVACTRCASTAGWSTPSSRRRAARASRRASRTTRATRRCRRRTPRAPQEPGGWDAFRARFLAEDGAP